MELVVKMNCQTLEVLAFNAIAREYLRQERRRHHEFLEGFPHFFRARVSRLLMELHADVTEALASQAEYLREREVNREAEERQQTNMLLCLYIIYAAIAFGLLLLVFYAIVLTVEGRRHNGTSAG